MGNSASTQELRDTLIILKTRRVLIGEDAIWDDLWSAGDIDIFELISPADVRELLDVQPENLKILVSQGIAQLCHVVDDPLSDYFDQALTCIRILTRIFPILYENYDNAHVQELLFAEKVAKTVEEYTLRTEDSKESAAIVEQKTTEADLSDTQPAETGATTTPPDQPVEPAADDSKSWTPSKDSLAAILVHCVYNLLFIENFTIDESDAGEEVEQTNTPGRKPRSSWLWAKGIASSSSTPPSTSSFLIRNRIEVLKLLLVLFSRPLYLPSTTPSTIDNNKTAVIATRSTIPFSEMILCSLLNSVLSYDPYGWGVPYTHMMAVDDLKAVAGYSSLCLLALIDFGVSHSTATETATQTSTSIDTVPGYNIFRTLISGLHKTNDFDIIFSGISRIMNHIHYSHSTLLPYSTTSIDFHPEVFVLLWKLIDENPLFVEYLLHNVNLAETVLLPICYVLHEYRRDNTKLSFVHACVFLLLRLSSEREFAVSLNRPYQSTLPIQSVMSLDGNYFDLVVLVLHKLIVSGSDKLASLHHACLTILSNLSPYTKNTSQGTSIKLVSLFQLFSSKKFLVVNSSNHTLTCLLLEVFNNIIQYQYESNSNLVYAIVRRAELFEKLELIELPARQQQHEEDKKEEKKVEKDDDDDEEPSNDIKTSTTQHHEEEQDTGKFIPTAVWLESIKASFPLATTLRLIRFLPLEIEQLAKARGLLTEDDILSFIRGTTLVGILPIPHPIIIRKFTGSWSTVVWFTAYIWGTIYIRNQDVPLFDGNMIKLFAITVA